MGALAYMKAFLVDGEALPATDRVRPWRDGRGGKVAECVGKALLLPEDMKHWPKWDDDTLLRNMKKEVIMGYQCLTIIEERFLAVKVMAEVLHIDNEDLLKKISDTMNKVFESEKLRAEAEENTKAVTERKEALEQELVEVKKTLTEKEAELKGYRADDEAKIQESYNQGQLDCISSVRQLVQQNLRVYFSKGWFAALDKMQVESSSSLRQESNITIPEELIIIPNPEIQAIINDESPVRVVKGAGPITGSGGVVTNSATAPTAKELPRA